MVADAASRVPPTMSKPDRDAPEPPGSATPPLHPGDAADDLSDEALEDPDPDDRHDQET